MRQVGDGDQRQLLFNLTGLVRRHLCRNPGGIENLLKLLEDVDWGLLDLNDWKEWVLHDFPKVEGHDLGIDGSGKIFKGCFNCDPHGRHEDYDHCRRNGETCFNESLWVPKPPRYLGVNEQKENRVNCAHEEPFQDEFHVRCDLGYPCLRTGDYSHWKPIAAPYCLVAYPPWSFREIYFAYFKSILDVQHQMFVLISDFHGKVRFRIKRTKG